MEFMGNLKDGRYIREEVTHFVMYPEGYYALLERGARLDIQRVFHIQPPIDDENDYFAWMFAQTFQGFFLFRQRILDKKVLPWEAYLELFPEQPHSFYDEAYGHWWKLRGVSGFPEK